MRKVWKYLGACLIWALLLTVRKESVLAANPSSNVNVTVQADIEIAFREDGSNTVSDCIIQNNTLVPIEVSSVKVTQHNGWELVPDSSYIYADTKQITLCLEGQSLLHGQNRTKHIIPEQSMQQLKMDIRRGAWTHSAKSEKALCLEMEYELGTKEFQLYFDENGSSECIEPICVRNGESIRLPVPEKDGYDFGGWQDQNGQTYMDEYVMPIGDTTLVAVWKERRAYGIYSESDRTLTFVTTSQDLQIGESYHDKTIDRVYFGFDAQTYTGYSQVPWYQDGTYQHIEHVLVEDEISPVSTAYWFYQFQLCMDYDLTNMNTSQVKDMQYMFYWAGRLGTGDFIIRGMEDWDVSKVTNMQHMFATSGMDANCYCIGNIGKWNVENVTSMLFMFANAGIRSSTFEIGDLSGWDTSKVTNMASMFSSAGKKAKTFDVGNIGNWNVSNVKSMESMFWLAGEYAERFYIGDIGLWNVGNVTDMSHMFAYAGYYAAVFEIGNLSGWNVENVTKFTATFWCAGKNAKWQLDCSNWTVIHAKSYSAFNLGVEDKVTPPKWVD